MTASQAILNSRVWRLWFLLGVLALGAAVLFYRAVQLHVYDHVFLSKEGDNRTIRFEYVDAHRGLIMDRHGVPLATSAPVETVYANPRQLFDKKTKQFKISNSELSRLAALLDENPSDLKAKLLKNKSKGFVYLKRKMAPHEVSDILALDLEGIYSKREYKRYYPAGEIASHVVGFTDIDERGQEGIELSYDSWLTGQAGKKLVLKNRKGEVIKDLEEGLPARPGRDIYLSIDMRLQYLAYRELKAAVETHRAKSGSLVVLDVHSGEVLAMVNQPSYNPNNRVQLEVAHLRNRAITDVFEPGSTMKLATVAAAFETGKYDLHTKLDTSPGAMRFGSTSIRDAANYGVLDVLKIISKSSNVGTSKIALDISGDAVWDMFYRLGFGRGTGIGFPGESIGSLPDSSHWQPVEVATMSYGYGLHATALQLAQAYMVLGNGGVKYPLSLIKKEADEPGERVLSSDVSRSLRQAMRAVVDSGTGKRAQVSMYNVGGKTGTVHRVGKEGYTSEYKALFAGVAPIDEPEIAVVVVIDSPAGKEYYGGEVAAPVFSRVVDGALRVLNVVPDKTATSPSTQIAEQKVKSKGKHQG